MPDEPKHDHQRSDYHAYILDESQRAISRSRRLLEETDPLVRPPYRTSARASSDSQYAEAGSDPGEMAEPS